MTFLWLVFIAIIVGFLVVDLGFLNRTAHVVSTKSAVKQTIFWVVISLAYAALIHAILGGAATAEFLSAYVTEKMLSVDNLFVILLIFNYFKLKPEHYHRLLYWGIFGAVILRGIFIGTGVAFISHFHWILYFFGAFLVYSGIKLLKNEDDDEPDFEKNKVLMWAKRHLPIDFGDAQSGKFISTRFGKVEFTMLAVILLIVETTDILFAFDSIPAVFSLTQNPFIAFTSNIFAVMGLRAIFFLVEGLMRKLCYLKEGLSCILVFIGGKMLAEIFGVHISSLTSFGFIIGVLLASALLSWKLPNK